MNLEIKEWWHNRPEEYFWLEVTGRKDLGANLKAPQTNESGDEEFWGYSLLKHVRKNDVVFHYDRGEQAIVSRSIATSDFWEDVLVWGARGSSARNLGIKPHTRPGWYVGLENYSRLEKTVTLGDIRKRYTEIVQLKKQLQSSVYDTLYFPFELGEKRPIRPMQGYLFKLPSFFVELFSDSLGDVTAVKQNQPNKADEQIGASYRFADEETSVGERDPFSVDPALVERGLRSHASTQNALASYLISKGVVPRSPKSDEPNFDLGWNRQGIIWVAEVKSLTKTNEEKQLRLGLGQLLRYRQILRGRGPVQAVLVTERQPTDQTWINLCQDLEIILVHPGNWHDFF
jgi:hypothetical protein